jgi:hypothetical protein
MKQSPNSVYKDSPGMTSDLRMIHIFEEVTVCRSADEWVMYRQGAQKLLLRIYRQGARFQPNLVHI